VWADTLLRAEQQHLLRLLIWAAACVLAATAIQATITVRRIRSPLLHHFSIQTAAWGIVIGAIAANNLRTVALRDLAGAARLERLAWLASGLDAGCAIAGITLAVAGWTMARRMAVVGAGLGIAVQGLALLVMELQFAAIVSR